MCLGVPMQVTSLSEDSAVVEFEGTRLEVRLDIVDRRPEVGDYVIVHAGFAIHWIDPEEAKITQQLLKDVVDASQMSEEEDDEELEEDEELDDEVSSEDES